MNKKISATVIINGLIVISFLIYLAVPKKGGGGTLNREDLLENYSLNPESSWVDWSYQVVTSQFFHGSVVHLLVNCVLIFFIGGELSRKKVLSEKEICFLFFVCGAFGGGIQVALTSSLPDLYALKKTVGSGFGLMALFGAWAFAARDSNQRLYLLFFPFRSFSPMESFFVVAGFFCVLFVLRLGSIWYSPLADLGMLVSLFSGFFWAYSRDTPWTKITDTDLL